VAIRQIATPIDRSMQATVSRGEIMSGQPPFMNGERMRRRNFLKISSMAIVAGACGPLKALASNAKGAAQPRFPDSNPKWKRTWDAAVATLRDNTKLLAPYDRPVLIEGAIYRGIWMECAPQEALVYANLGKLLSPDARPSRLDLARANHMAFFALQRQDGQLPAYIWMHEVGFGQIQMVVPIAATAWELVQLTRDEELLTTAYAACGRWDSWLRRYRDTRKTGLVEGFCTFDTGHDNSPRWAGIPNSCPGEDARKCPQLASLPRLCPDLSATVYGGRVALSAMANALGKQAEADRWHEDAERIRQLIIDRLYCPEDAAFYDLDANDHFVRVRSDVISRVMGEHVLNLEIASDRRIFDSVWTRQLHNPKAFWSPFPFPSIALDDPTFVRPIPLNSWGGAAQALTALRAPRWMEHYGKHKELVQLMRQWVVAINASGDPAGKMYEQMDPVTGQFTAHSENGYSPAALVYLDFVRRLSGAFPSRCTTRGRE
jgi:hypothetical protein